MNIDPSSSTVLNFVYLNFSFKLQLVNLPTRTLEENNISIHLYFNTFIYFHKLCIINK